MMKKIICFAAAGLLMASTETQAHRIEYYTPNGCVVAGQALVIEAYVVAAPSSTNYRWVYKTAGGSWTCFNNGTNNINGTNFTVSNVSGTGANNAPDLTISNPGAALDNVEIRCLMRENASPCNAPSGTTWGGDDLNKEEVKTLRLRYNAVTGACSISCQNNLLSNSDGFYGGFEAATLSNGSITDKNFLSGAGSSDYSNNGSGTGSFKVKNNPYDAYSSVIPSTSRFAPHSGNFQMVVRGNTTASADIWYKTITVQPGQTYSFSVWVSKVDNTVPRIQLKAGNAELVATQITAAIGTWTQVTATYSVPPGVTSQTFAIRDRDAATAAHNYVLDDICLVKTADPISIGDRVWFDVNRNGAQDSGEPGINGVTVKLFYDNNSDNVADSANATYTTTTNASGNYTFTGVIPGKYFVQFTLASGYDAFTTQDAAGVPVGQNSTANVTTGKTGTHDFTADYMFKDAGMVKNFGISGNVFNDVNGLTDNTVNGTLISALGTTPLYANLYKGTTFVASTLVSAGTYTFNNLPGNTSYTISISTVAGTASSTPASVLTAGWANTGEFLGTTAGNDGTVNGLLTVSLGTSGLSNANFGIEELPTPTSLTAAPQPNPGGTNGVTVPPATFGGTDPSGGTITSLRITTFPTGATSITINGTNYTAANFPPAGVSVPTNTTGQPTQTIIVDPAAEGATTVVITFKVTDNAGKESTTTGTATIPFSGFTVSGTVFNDVNGLTDNTVNGTGIGSVSSQQLKAYLTKAGVIMDSVNVAANGTYTFTNAFANTSYVIVVTTVSAAIGGSTPAVTLPAGWVNTGEFLGTGAGNDGNANGSLAVNVATSNVSNANFGMEQLPTPASNTAAGQPNPGGTNSATVPAATFGGTDPSGGTITSLRITTFPTGATSITINGTNYTAGNFPSAGVSVPTNATGQPTQTITVDPAAEGATTVVITFKVTDNAGKESTTTGTATVPFTGLSISGKVFNDVNGLTDNTVNGTGIGSVSSQQLKAYLTSTAGVIVDSVNVAADGTYTFDNASGNTNYVVIVSTVTAAIGSSNPAATLPAGWVYTGEFLGTGAGNDGNANGSLAVSVATSNVSNANFGMEQLPTPTSNTAAGQPNPGGTNSATVPAATFGGTDPSGGTITSLRITTFPTGATSITINGTNYTAGNFPSAGVSVPTNATGQPTQTIAVDPAAEGATTVVITFKVTDNAGKESTTTGTATVPFTGLSISGTVFNDVNGLTDNTVNGTGIGSVSSQQLKAYLTSTSGVIVDSVNVAANGTYTFTNASGNTNYVVVVSTVNVAIGSSNPAATLPAGWVYTGEFLGTGAGNDGNANGSLAVNVATSNVSNANFGMEQLPTPTSNTAANQLNPGGTNNATVPAATFGGTDPSGGTITSLRITTFPTGATSITINGTNYTAGNFPSAGVSVPTNASGQPTQTIAVDPAAEGATSVVITFKVTDNAGKESTTTGTATVPFTGLNISGKVFNDANGLTDNMVNGTGIGSASSQQLKAYLTKTSGGVIIDSVNVAANGTFTLDNASANSSYVVIVTTASVAIGSTNPPVTLPAGWVNTGEIFGTGTGSDGNANGALTVSVATTNASNANFGIEERPTAGTYTASPQINPGDTLNVTVPPAAFVSSDVPPGTVTAIKITALPTNTNSITIGNVKYTAAGFPAGGIIIPVNASGEPVQPIKIDPVDGTVTASIPFMANDNANVLSANTGAANVPVYEVPDLTPIITVTPSTMYSTSNFMNRMDIWNLGNVPTSGLITVYLTKSALINYTFNPTLTTAAGMSVQNSAWTLDAETNSSYYIFTTNTVIPAQSRLSFGLNGVLTPASTQGQLNNTVIINPGSGTENNFTNNTDADVIYYFQN